MKTYWNKLVTWLYNWSVERATKLLLPHILHLDRNNIVKLIRNIDCTSGIHSEPQWVPRYSYYYGKCGYCNNQITPDHFIDTRAQDCSCKKCDNSLYRRLINRANSDKVLTQVILDSIAPLR